MKIMHNENVRFIPEGPAPGRFNLPPLPPHERRELLNIEFDGADLTLLTEAFGDEDTALAAARIIQEAPPEMKVLACLLLRLLEKEAG